MGLMSFAAVLGLTGVGAESEAAVDTSPLRQGCRCFITIIVAVREPYGRNFPTCYRNTASSQNEGFDKANKYYEGKYKEFEKTIGGINDLFDKCISAENTFISGGKTDFANCISASNSTHLKSFIADVWKVETEEKEALQTIAAVEPNSNYYGSSVHEMLQLDSLVLISTSKVKELLEKREIIQQAAAKKTLNAPQESERDTACSYANRALCAYKVPIVVT